MCCFLFVSFSSRNFFSFKIAAKKQETAEAATKAQKDALFDFLAEHTDLARGLLRGADARERAKRLWTEISASLNSMGGSTKSVLQWQRVWFDKKSKVKHSAAACNRSAGGTGGGPSTAEDLTATDLKVLAIMGDGFGEPQTAAKVQAFPSQSQQIPQSHPTEQMIPPVPTLSTAPEILPRSQTSPQPCQDGQSSTSQRQPRRVQCRRVRVASDDSVRSRLFHLEEQRLASDNRRNEELAGIKEAVLELCLLVNKFVSNV